MKLIASHRACGKVILMGEHFVVHGAPAMAVPLTSLATTVELYRKPDGGPNRLESDAEDADLGLAQQMMHAAVDQLGLPAYGGLVARVRSSIPVGFGLGSSAALSVALAGALARAAGGDPSPAQLNRLAHHLERVTHGRPSGIDDTVVSRGEPIFFTRGEPTRTLRAPQEPKLVLASSGEPGSTREAVAGVQAFAQGNAARFAKLCEEAEELVDRGREALEGGDLDTLGQAMNRNHAMLRELGVSTAELDRLVERARGAGALGAKLTGAGRGGFCIALAPEQGASALAEALRSEGSPLVVLTAAATSG